MKINKKFLVVALVMTLIGLGFYHDLRTNRKSNDFDTYYLAGKFVRTGQNIYTALEFKTTTSPYLYLPFFAVVMSPFTYLTMREAAVLWYLLNIAALAGAFSFAMGLLGEKRRFYEIFFNKVSVLKLIAVIFPMIIWLDNLSLAQVDFMLFAIMLLSLLVSSRGRPYLAGALMAVAAVIKIYPAYFLFYYVIKRRFKEVAGFGIGIFFAVFLFPVAALGMRDYNMCMAKWLEMRVEPHITATEKDGKKIYDHFNSQFKPSNQSLSSLETRFFMKDDLDVDWWKKIHRYKIPWPHTLTPAQVDKSVKVSYLVILLVTFLSLAKKAKPGVVPQALEYSIMFTGMILLFPVVQTHMFAGMSFFILLVNKIKDDTGQKWLYGRKALDIIFFTAFALYVSQAFEYMKVLEAGCISVIMIWLLSVIMLKEEKRAID